MTLHSKGQSLSPVWAHPPLPSHLLYSLYKWRRSVFIVRRVARQPADGGLPWPWWTSGASFRRRLLTRWLTALASRVHRAAVAATEVFCCVRSFVLKRQDFFFHNHSLSSAYCLVRREIQTVLVVGGSVRCREVWIQRRVHFNKKRHWDALVSLWGSVWG